MIRIPTATRRGPDAALPIIPLPAPLFLTLLLQLFSPIILSAGTGDAHITFEHLTRNQGLSHSIVYSVAQDDRGFMWFGTQDGLNRFDGYTVKVFRHDPENPDSVAADNAGNVFKDSRGMLWIGTWGSGVDLLDPSTGRFTHFRHDPDNSNSLGGNRVQTIFEDSRGALWFATFRNGVTRYDRQSGTFTRYPYDPGDPGSLSHPRARTIAEDRTGSLWIATSKGLNRLDPETGKTRHYFHDPRNPSSIGHNTVYKVHAGPSGTLWVGTSAGLDRYNPDTDTFTPFRHDPGNPDSISRGEVATLFEDSTGILWIGMYASGLSRFDPRTGLFRNHSHDPRNPDGPGGNDIRAIHEDRSGIIWLGTAGSGVDRFHPGRGKFLHVRHAPFQPNGLGPGEVTALFEDSGKNLWVGTRGGGISLFHGERGGVTRLLRDSGEPGAPGSDLVTVIYGGPSGHVWIGTEDAGLEKRDARARLVSRYRHAPENPLGLPDDYIVSLLEEGDETLWVGTYQGGLCRLRPGEAGFTRYVHDPGDPHSLAHDEVNALLGDRRGNLWVGTAGGLNLLDREKNRFIRFRHDPDNPRSIGSNWVQVIREAGDGTLWVGTRDGGLNRFDPVTGIFTRFSTRSGLPSNAVHGILEDDRGYLWLSTNNGLSRFDPGGESFRNFTVEDGLQGNEFRPRSFHMNSQGELFFGGTNGFNRFRPERIRNNPHRPPVVLTDFRKFGRSADPGGPLSSLERLELSHRDKFISFEFAALEYSNPLKNRYAYKLLGLNEEWIHLGEKRTASFTNLDSGRYTFRVKASNNDGVWNEEGLSIAIHVSPPFWRTWWAHVLYALFTAGLILEYVRRRTRAYRHELALQEKLRTELEEKVRERTSALTEVNDLLLSEVEERKKTEQALRLTTRALEDANLELREMAAVDGLTQIANRRRFDEYLGLEWRRAVRSGRTISLLLCDLDCFKAFNDTYGHPAGDEALKQTARLLGKTARRSSDLPARYGGEEFAVILPETGIEDARRLAEALLDGIRALRIPHKGSTTGSFLTLSIGAASAVPTRLSLHDTLVAEADRALYTAKKEGRNRVSVAYRDTGEKQT